MGAGAFGVELDAHAGAVPDLDLAVAHDRVGQAVDDVVPPGGITRGVFEGYEIAGQRGADLDQGGEAEQAVAGAVRGHHDAVQVGVLGDPFQLGDAADVAGVGADDVDGVALDQLLEVLPEVDLLAGVDGGGGGAGEVAVDVGVDVGDVVAGQHVLEPHEVVLLHGAGEADGVGDHPAGAAVQREADLVAEDLLHGGDAVDDVVEAAFGHQAGVEGAVEGAGGGGAVVEVLELALLRAVEGDALLDDGEALGEGEHPLAILGIMLGRGAAHGHAEGAVVGADVVADLAAEELVDGDAGGLAGEIPQRHLDDADRRAVGLEGAALADFQHHALDVGGVLADQRLAELQHEGLEVGLPGLHRAVAGEAFVGDEAQDRVLADDGDLGVGDFHFRAPLGES